MALPSDKLTVSYTQIMAIPIQSRTKLAANGLADMMARALTPGQRAALFPSYYREASLGATGSVGSLTGSGFLGGSHNSPPSGYSGGTTYVPPSIQESERSLGIIPGAGTGAGSWTKAYNASKVASNIKDMSPQDFLKSQGHGDIPVDSLPQGMRHNNPGNIKYSGQGWLGETGSAGNDQGDPQSVFNSPEAGMRAMAKLLMNKYNGVKTSRPLKTLNDIIAASDGWTPGARHAVGNLAKSMDIDPDADLGLNDPAKLKPLMRALIDQEQGTTGSLYTNDLIDRGIALTQENPGETSPELYSVAEQEFIDKGNAMWEAEHPTATAMSDPNMIPAGDLQNRVLELQGKVAGIRKGDLNSDFKNTLNLTANQLSEATGKNIIAKVTSGGQRMEGAWGSKGSHQHDDGMSADFNWVEIMPDGSERIIDIRKPADAKIVNLSAELFAANGGRTVGAAYMDDPTKLHYGIPDVEHDGVRRAYDGPQSFRDAFNKGAKVFLEKAAANGWNEESGYREVYVNTISQIPATAEPIVTATGPESYTLNKEAMIAQIREDNPLSSAPLVGKSDDELYQMAVDKITKDFPEIKIAEDGTVTGPVKQLQADWIKAHPDEKPMDLQRYLTPTEPVSPESTQATISTPTQITPVASSVVVPSSIPSDTTTPQANPPANPPALPTNMAGGVGPIAPAKQTPSSITEVAVESKMSNSNPYRDYRSGLNYTSV